MTAIDLFARFDPSWRTPDVLAICEGLRASQVFDGLYALADALQEAGCNDEGILSYLRDETCVGARAVAAVALVYSDETADAVRWVDDLARKLGPNYGYDSYEAEEAAPDQRDDYVVDRMDYFVLMEDCADADADEDYYRTQVGDEQWRNVMHEVGYDALWARYALITGTTPSNPTRGFYSCSC